jgi:predicted TIM-barrel fold metal-dependent hydrolase
MTRIDAHAHHLPDGYVEVAGGIPVLPAPLEGLEAMMARHDIDAAVISTGPPGAFLGDVDQARELARAGNEGIAAVVREAPHRFAGLALLPLPDVDASLAELPYALDRLQLDGVMLLTNVAGTYLGDPAWDAVLAELDRRGAYVFVHPTLPPYQLPSEQPVWLYEFPFETVRAVAQLIYGGAFERYPSIRWQFSHLGGAAPFLAHRLASLADREPEAAAAAPAGALEYLGRQYYDTGLSNNAPALAATREVTATDHIVFGTDWPYAALPPEGGDPAPGLDVLGEDVRRAVEAENVAALVPRLVEAARQTLEA